MEVHQKDPKLEYQPEERVLRLKLVLPNFFHFSLFPRSIYLGLIYLDSIRFRFDLEKVHAEIAVAHELFPVVLNRGGIEPEDDDLVHILASASWAWARGQELGLFALHTEDYSSQQPVDPQCVADLPPGLPPGGEAFFLSGCVAYEDDSDADLTWLGVSAEGRLKIPKYGRINYWFEAARVFGNETYTDYTGETGARKVSAIDTHNVSGVGFDIGGKMPPTIETKVFQSSSRNRLVRLLGHLEIQRPVRNPFWCVEMRSLPLTGVSKNFVSLAFRIDT